MVAVARLEIRTINVNKYSTAVLLYITSNMSNLIITIGTGQYRSFPQAAWGAVKS